MSASKVTLYFAPGASSIFPHFLLYHCGISFTASPVLFQGPKATSQSSLAKINPKLQVPVLVVDGETVTENPAIAHAIHQLAPEKKIFGEGNGEFIKVCEWMNFISASLHAQSWSPWMRPWRFTTDESEAGQKALKDMAERNVREKFGVLEGGLSEGGPWALGERFTAVDAYLLVFWRLGKGVLKADMEGEYPKWGGIVERVMEMEAAGKVMKDEADARNS